MGRINMGQVGKISMSSDHRVEWSIDKFLSYTVVGHYYESPRFAISSTPGTAWSLRVYPNGEITRNCGWVSLYLVKHDGGAPLPIKARYSLGVKKVDGTLQQIGSRVTWMFDKDIKGIWYRVFLLLRRRWRFTACGYPRFLERSKLLKKQSEYLASETLTLTCTLWTGAYCEQCGSLDTLSRNFADLFTSKRGCDATIRVRDVEFPVHKWVLSSRSPVLAAMFESDMKETRTGLVEIPDLDPGTFKEFLNFLYSGKVKNASCDAFELYEIADKYDVEDLKSECVIAVMSNLSVDNVLDAAILGSYFNECLLIPKVEQFFKKNYKQIISSPYWDASFLSEHATVANRLLKSIAKKK